MNERTPRQESPIHSLNENVEPTIKVTRENLDHALRILRQVLDEEATQ